MLDPARRWGRFGKPDYAGLLSYGGMPWTEEAAHLEGVDVAIVERRANQDLAGSRAGG